MEKRDKTTRASNQKPLGHGLSYSRGKNVISRKRPNNTPKEVTQKETPKENEKMGENCLCHMQSLPVEPENHAVML